MSSSSRPGKARRLWREKVGDGRRGGEEEEGGGAGPRVGNMGGEEAKKKAASGSERNLGSGIFLSLRSQRTSGVAVPWCV